MTDLELARHLAALADELALGYFDRGFRTSYKYDGSPVKRPACDGYLSSVPRQKSGVSLA